MTIDELKALEQESTPGPWRERWTGVLGYTSIHPEKRAKPLRINIQRGSTEYTSYGNVPPEGALLVTLRNLAPELIALAEAANKVPFNMAEWGEGVMAATNALYLKMEAMG